MCLISQLNQYNFIKKVKVFYYNYLNSSWYPPLDLLPMNIEIYENDLYEEDCSGKILTLQVLYVNYQF